MTDAELYLKYVKHVDNVWSPKKLWRDKNDQYFMEEPADKRMYALMRYKDKVMCNTVEPRDLWRKYFGR